MKTGNLIYQTSTTTGTGNFTTSSVTGYRDFSSEFGTGTARSNYFYYCIRHTTAAEYEVGIGHMSASNTLVRDTVIESSNSNSLVNFSSGTKSVISDFPAETQNQFTTYGNSLTTRYGVI